MFFHLDKAVKYLFFVFAVDSRSVVNHINTDLVL
jgi:hypothetical protein